MDTIIGLLFIVVVLPLVLIIIGIVKLFNNDELKRKTGIKLLLGGLCLFGVFAIIGFSICSNMSFGGMH